LPVRDNTQTAALLGEQAELRMDLSSDNRLKNRDEGRGTPGCILSGVKEEELQCHVSIEFF
jgi:hypothetical protein